MLTVVHKYGTRGPHRTELRSPGPAHSGVYT